MGRLLQGANFHFGRVLGLLFVLAIILEAYAYSSGLLSDRFLRPLLATLVISTLIWALYNDQSEHPTADWAMTVASALYLGFLLSHFVLLREIGHANQAGRWLSIPRPGLRDTGFGWVLTAMALAWVTDSTAFFVGSALGRHKLWPRISPKKTWEGLAGGSLGAVLAGPVLGSWLLGLPAWQGILLGLLAALADPFGDFAISLFKRVARSKDSSQLIPGHGGILDRLDSLLFIFPLITYFAYLVTGIL